MLLPELGLVNCMPLSPPNPVIIIVLLKIVLFLAPAPADGKTIPRIEFAVLLVIRLLYTERLKGAIRDIPLAAVAFGIMVLLVMLTVIGELRLMPIEFAVVPVIIVLLIMVELVKLAPCMPFVKLFSPAKFLIVKLSYPPVAIPVPFVLPVTV